MKKLIFFIASYHVTLQCGLNFCPWKHKKLASKVAYLWQFRFFFLCSPNCPKWSKNDNSCLKCVSRHIYSLICGWNHSWYPGWNYGLKNSGLKCHVTSWCNASIQNSGEPFLSRWRMSLCRSVKCKSPSGAKWKRSSKPETLCLLFLQNLCPSEWILKKIRK